MVTGTLRFPAGPEENWDVLPPPRLLHPLNLLIYYNNITITFPSHVISTIDSQFIYLFIIFLYPISYGCEASRHSILSSHFILTFADLFFSILLGIGMDLFVLSF